MPLQTNAVFTFRAFEIQQDGSVLMTLTCPLPGDDLPGKFQVTLIPADVAVIQAQGTLAAQKTKAGEIVSAYLVALYRPPVSSIASALTSLIGQTVTV